MSRPSLPPALLTALSALAAGMLCGEYLPPRRPPDSVPPPNKSTPPPAATPAPSPPRPKENNPASIDHLLAKLTSGSSADQAAAALELSSLTSPTTIRDLLTQQHRWPATAIEQLIRTVLMARWAELDPEGAFLYTRDQLLPALPDATTAFARTDPERARSILLAMSPGEHRTMAWRNLCLAQLPDHPQITWEMLEAGPMRDSIRSAYARASVLEQLVKLDPAAAEARMPRLTSRVLDETRQSLAQLYFKRDPDTGWHWIRNQPHPEKLITRVIEGIIPDDPLRTLTLLSELPPHMLGTVREFHPGLWKTKKPEVLVSALATNPNLTDTGRRDLAKFFFQSILVENPQQVEGIIPLLPPGHVKLVVNYWVNYYAEKSPARMERFVDRLPPGIARDHALANSKYQQSRK